MRSRPLRWRVPFVAVALLFMAGCANTTFVYKPNAPSAGGPKLPVKVAVLPFKDGTEDFTIRGSTFSGGYKYNLTKTGIGDLISPLPPAQWAKSFADDMTASGGFQAVRFIYSASELMGEEFYIEGTLGKAYFGLPSYTSGTYKPNEFALGLRATRRADSKLVWEKEIAREWKNPAPEHGCGLPQCAADKVHADINRVMQSMFAEARADLVETLASLSKGGAGEARKDKETSKPQDPASVEQTIDRILKGK